MSAGPEKITTAFRRRAGHIENRNDSIDSTSMVQDFDKDTSTANQGDDIENLVDLAVRTVMEPAADFTLRFSESLKAANTGKTALRIDEDRVAREIARVIVLDLVQSGVRGLTKTGAVKSDTVLEIYNQACSISDRAVKAALEDARHHGRREYGT